MSIATDARILIIVASIFRIANTCHSPNMGYAKKIDKLPTRWVRVVINNDEYIYIVLLCRKLRGIVYVNSTESDIRRTYDLTSTYRIVAGSPLSDAESVSIRAVRFVGQNNERGCLPRCVRQRTKFAAELRNQTSFSATEVRPSGRGRPSGDNEPKVTATGWCLRYCCRWLSAELDGAWPRFPWFTEVPNPRAAFEDALRALRLHNESFYLHGTYVLARVPALRCSGNLCVPSRSFLIRQIRIEEWRHPLQVTRPRQRWYLIRATWRGCNAWIRKICRALGVRKISIYIFNTNCNYIFLHFSSKITL